ncbi:MAG: arginine repressor [Acidimicrobiia bacterium]|nr:arginine repressor [Acidimicrobiia bacterium]NNC74820.1 arginine repressor [Acidimicrobiia bacterium]
MNGSTAARRRVLRRLISGSVVTNQADVVDQLAAEGFDVSQATVSRDLDAVGAVKETTRSGSRYRIGPAHTVSHDELSQRLTGFAERIDGSGNLVVIHTPPGAAHLVAGALDGAGLPEVLGTVAGDDTVLVVAAAARGASKLVKTLETLGGLE